MQESLVALVSAVAVIAGVVALVSAVAVIAGVVAIVMLVAGRDAHREIGDGGLHWPAGDDAPGADADAARDEEIRQMLSARSARSERRGEHPPDLDAELAALLRPADDDGLREEVRALVDARSRRRARSGLDLLDVEAEIARRLREPN